MGWNTLESDNVRGADSDSSAPNKHSATWKVLNALLYYQNKQNTQKRMKQSL